MAGEYQTIAGKNYCEAVKPGYAAPKSEDQGMKNSRSNYLIFSWFKGRRGLG